MHWFTCALCPNVEFEAYSRRTGCGHPFYKITAQASQFYGLPASIDGTWRICSYHNSLPSTGQPERPQPGICQVCNKATEGLWRPLTPEIRSAHATRDRQLAPKATHLTNPSCCQACFEQEHPPAPKAHVESVAAAASALYREFGHLAAGLPFLRAPSEYRVDGARRRSHWELLSAVGGLLQALGGLGGLVLYRWPASRLPHAEHLLAPLRRSSLAAHLLMFLGVLIIVYLSDVPVTWWLDDPDAPRTPGSICALGLCVGALGPYTAGVSTSMWRNPEHVPHALSDAARASHTPRYFFNDASADPSCETAVCLNITTRPDKSLQPKRRSFRLPPLPPRPHPPGPPGQPPYPPLPGPPPPLEHARNDFALALNISDIPDRRSMCLDTEAQAAGFWHRAATSAFSWFRPAPSLPTPSGWWRWDWQTRLAKKMCRLQRPRHESNSSKLEKHSWVTRYAPLYKSIMRSQALGADIRKERWRMRGVLGMQKQSGSSLAAQAHGVTMGLALAVSRQRALVLDTDFNGALESSWGGGSKRPKLAADLVADPGMLDAFSDPSSMAWTHAFVRLRYRREENLCALARKHRELKQAVETSFLGVHFETYRHKNWIATKQALTYRDTSWGSEFWQPRHADGPEGEEMDGWCTIVESCLLRESLAQPTLHLLEGLAPLRSQFTRCDTVVVAIHLRLGDNAALQWQLEQLDKQAERSEEQAAAETYHRAKSFYGYQEALAAFANSSVSQPFQSQYARAAFALERLPAV
ncbi:hypothetical protein CYMTET_22859 [Cymbomonas tetramitiformis]|uniref:Uncharacterized protein n=1 Tax=Cymbomonas tetramitiformis TaxID=36881 RepID=A0AAE0L1H7_9CHLO|nr:hypothetical protein CYMTET_22859 [Cymbomonas tetramitiformis]